VATKSLAVFALLVLLIGFYYFAIRPDRLRWSATSEELVRPLPGDYLVPPTSLCAASAVWASATSRKEAQSTCTENS
jgi:hypothetical protein